MQGQILCFWCGQSVDSAGVYTDRQGEQQHVCSDCIDNAETVEED